MYNEGMKQYFFKAIIVPGEEGGFTAYVPKLPGCVSEGETYEECLANIKEAAAALFRDRPGPGAQDN